MTLSTHIGYMVYEDLSHYELVPISVLNSIPKMYSTHMFKNVTLSLWLEVITQKSYLLKEMKLKTTHEKSFGNRCFLILNVKIFAL